ARSRSPMSAPHRLHESHPHPGSARETPSDTEPDSSSSSEHSFDTRTGAVVIDIGTGSFKAGFAGQQKPTSEIGTLVASPSRPSLESTRTQPQTFFGEEALLHDADSIGLTQSGIIINWEAAEILWQHMFDHDLMVAPEEHALLITDPPLSPSTSREKLVEMAFESLHSPGIYIASQSVLSVYAHGQTSGLVVDAGYAVTHTVPVDEGYSLSHAVERMDIAGSHMTHYLMKLLRDSGYMLSEAMTQVIEDIKHKCCYVASDFENECYLPEAFYTVDFPLPDGQTISLGKERFQCPEVLFNPPQTDGIPYVGIHEMTQRSLNKLPEAVREKMCQNILLCGGSSLFEGLEKRFSGELLQKMPSQAKIRVSAIPLRRYSAWMGGSILASLKNFQSFWIRKEDYSEHGPYIVHQKCY
ncbi:ACTL9 protein, partial [Nothoprocta ornata]|nr:ACTL9 protein [Nothoprocta pentlandii]NWY07941.1 ACTL9 protein [Nothoprocta ornata]